MRTGHEPRSGWNTFGGDHLNRNAVPGKNDHILYVRASSYRTTDQV